MDRSDPGRPLTDIAYGSHYTASESDMMPFFAYEKERLAWKFDIFKRAGP